VARLADEAWPGVPARVTHDLETALKAAEIQEDDRSISRVLVLSGTGSCCYGRSPSGKTAKLGGWGHVLGDKGSGYEIGLRALKAVVYYFDRDGTWSRLGQQILRKLQLNEPGDLIDWVQAAAKDEIAALATEVFAASARRDRIARDILEGAASSLAKDAVSCAKRITKLNDEVEFVFAEACC
jgi:N-acetylglucosamine kinase-like BadF-type ATPase